MPRRRFLLLFGVFLTLAVPVEAASEDAVAIEAAMRIADVFAVVSEEGLAYGESLEDEMFPGDGGDKWMATVRDIYATTQTLPVFRAAFAQELIGSDSDHQAMLAFFSSDLGRKLTTLEISARRALLDEAVGEASRQKLEQLRSTDDPRLGLVETFVEANDLVEANVSGGLNANYAFYQGLRDAGALGPELDESGIIAEIWGQESSIRDETDLWIHSYLVMAYAPLSDEELGAYIAFSRTKPGQALNRALFAGFDAVFVDVSRQLGRAAGVVLVGQEL